MNKNTNIEDQYYITGFYQDCVDNFIFFRDCFSRYLNGEKKLFKWIVLSVFTFLQELFILALRNGSTSSLIKKNYLPSFEDLIKMIKDQYKSTNKNGKKIPVSKMHWGINSKPFIDSSGIYTNNLRTLNNIRDNFIHLKSDSWLVNYSCFDKIIPSCLEIAIFLIEDSHNVPDYEGKMNNYILPELKKMQDYFNKDLF